MNALPKKIALRRLLHNYICRLDDMIVELMSTETGEDVTDFHVRGGEYALEIAQIIGAKRVYLKGGSPSCNKDGIVGEILRRGGVNVVRVG